MITDHVIFSVLHGVQINDKAIYINMSNSHWKPPKGWKRMSPDQSDYQDPPPIYYEPVDYAYITWSYLSSPCSLLMADCSLQVTTEAAGHQPVDHPHRLLQRPSFPWGDEEAGDCPEGSPGGAQDAGLGDIGRRLGARSSARSLSFPPSATRSFPHFPSPSSVDASTRTGYTFRTNEQGCTELDHLTTAQIGLQ